MLLLPYESQSNGDYCPAAHQIEILSSDVGSQILLITRLAQSPMRDAIIHNPLPRMYVVDYTDGTTQILGTIELVPWIEEFCDCAESEL